MNLQSLIVRSKKIIPLIFAAVIFLTLTPLAQAQDSGRIPSPPNFPKCEDKLSARGDRSHLDSGSHSIPGKGTLEGKDDVYTLTSGNFLQCFCPTSGDTGIQSDWWYINGLPMGRVDIDAYERDGWLFEENGSDWNLLAGAYLIKNEDFSCSGAKTPTATPVVTQKPGPSATPNPVSSCSNLSVTPKEGTAPLTVKFTGFGNDPNGDVKGYEFNFDDASNNQEKIVQQDSNEITHVYNTVGTYRPSLRIQDSNGNWKNGNSDCTRTITVRSTPAVQGSSDTTELPDTGLPLSSFFALMILGEIGYVVYKRFQLV